MSARREEVLGPMGSALEGVCTEECSGEWGNPVSGTAVPCSKGDTWGGGGTDF